MSLREIHLTVNGEARSATVENRLLLVHCIRENLGLTGTHRSEEHTSELQSH